MIRLSGEMVVHDFREHSVTGTRDVCDFTRTLVLEIELKK